MNARSLVAALLALTIAGTASASSGVSWIGVNGGVTLPVGDLADVAGTGFFIGGDYHYPMDHTWALGANINYHKFAEEAGVELSALQYTGYLRYMFPSEGTGMHSYLKGGLGAYSFSASGGGSDTNFGLNFGGGFGWMTSPKMGWGLEGAYHYVSSEGSSLSMVTVGVGVEWGVGGP